MVSYPSVKKRMHNSSSGDFVKSITKIQTREISQAKAFFKYGTPRQTLAQKCNEKIDNVEDIRPGPFPVLGGSVEKDLVQ